LLGTVRSDLATAPRSAPAGRHVVFYRAVDDAIVVLRVLHDRMDVHWRIEASAAGAPPNPVARRTRTR
jgi:plasmid stabilization system protein ParE